MHDAQLVEQFLIYTAKRKSMQFYEMGQLCAADSAMPIRHRQLDAGDSARGHFGAASVT